MSGTGLLIVFGSLALVTAIGVGGAILGGAWGSVLLGLAIFGGVGWLIGSVMLLNALNSDI